MTVRTRTLAGAFLAAQQQIDQETKADTIPEQRRALTINNRALEIIGRKPGTSLIHAFREAMAENPAH